MVAFDGLVVFCADIRVSARFYEEGLGLVRDWSDDDHIQFHLPTKSDDKGAWLLLHPTTDGGTTPHYLGTFTVEDVDAAVAKLRDAGYRITEGPEDAPWGVREAGVTDTDGYGLTLTAPSHENPSDPES